MTRDRRIPAGARRTRLLAVPVVLALLPVLGSCSGGEEKQGATPEDTLAAAKKNLDATSGVRIGLFTEALPSGVRGLLAADGVGTHDPAFQGTIKVATSGVTADADVVAVDDKVYAKLPFSATFVPIDPDRYGAPDPADLLEPEGGLSSLLTAADEVQTGDKVREGKAVLSSYTAKVPGTAVASVIPSADAKASFAAIFTVTDDDRLDKAVLSGPFYPGSDDVTYDITFRDYGTSKTIKAP
jgi:lipoprotein LprG